MSYCPQCAKYEAELRAARQDAARYRTALQELVACKDLKDAPVLKMTKETEMQRMDYERRKPLAWAAARAAIAKGGPT